MEEAVLDNGIPVDTPAAAVEAAPETVEADAPQPTWAPSHEEWQALTGSVAQLSQTLTPVPVQQAPPGVTDYFPVDPTTGEASLTLEGLDRYVNDRIDAGVQQRIGNYEPVLNQTVADRGEQLITQKFDTLAQSGDFDRTLARELAEGYASSGVDPNTAIEKAAARAREFAQQQRQAGADELRGTIKNIGNAPREPGVNGSGVAVDDPLPIGHPDRYKQITEAWVARNRIS